jgi:hypothetical protein
MTQRHSGLYRWTWIVCTTFLTFMFPLACVNAGPSGSVSGSALDLGVGTGNTSRGIAGVRVRVIPSGGAQPRETLTNADGKYAIKEVPVGAAKVEFKHNAYLRLPTVVDAEIKLDAMASADAEMILAAAPEMKYYEMVGESLAHRAEKRTAVYQIQWKFLQGLSLAPRSKVVICRSMSKADSNLIQAIPGMRPYVSAEPEAVARLSQDVRHALQEPAGIIPTPDATRNIPPEVVADVVTYIVTQHAQSENARAEFMKRFQGAWGKELTDKINHRIDARRLNHP